MPQQDVELILMRQLASYLTMPIFLYGPDERLLFYNEAAEKLLALPFDEADDLPPDRLSTFFRTKTEAGKRMPAKDLPIVIALRERKPAHGTLRFRGLDGVWRTIAVTALPLMGQGSRPLGAVAIFWEKDPAE